MPISLTSEIQNSDARTDKHVALWIFAMLFFSYGYFHQGGGWGQNSRFDQVRAIVEKQEIAINDFWLYRVAETAAGFSKIVRLPIPQTTDSMRLRDVANTWDISYFNDKVLPNKPPGTVIIAVPAYWIIHRVESALGLDSDDWWILTLNAYLTTVFSIGLIAALGGLAFYHLSYRLSPDSPRCAHVASTLTYGLGTMTFPFATIFFDHVLVASISIVAFFLLLIVPSETQRSIRSEHRYFLTGVLCGITVAVNYVAIMTVGCMLVYGLWTTKIRIKFLLYVLAGLAVPVALLFWYHIVYFGSPFATANTHQVGVFRSSDALVLGMLGPPKLAAVYALLLSSYRGLFFTSPVLLLGLIAVFVMGYDGERRPEALLCGLVFFAYLLMNSAFNNWHAGWTFGPRYLIPAIPFIAVPLARVFVRIPRLTVCLAVISIFMMFLFTAVDPQVTESAANPLSDHILRIVRGDNVVIEGVSVDVPLSANPLGVFESSTRPATGISTAQRRWHSFNLGEFIWQGSFWSLMPLITFLGIGFFSVTQRLRKVEMVRPVEVVEEHSTS